MSGLVMDLSTQNTKITYVNLVNQTTPIILDAPGKDDWLSVDDAEGGEMVVGCDGTLAVWMKPTKATGKLTFLALSPALQNCFVKVMQAQQQLGFSILGTLTVASATGLWSETYNNFMITSAYPGLGFGVNLKDVVVNWSSGLPNTSNASTYIAVGEAITTLI